MLAQTHKIFKDFLFTKISTLHENEHGLWRADKAQRLIMFKLLSYSFDNADE